MTRPTSMSGRAAMFTDEQVRAWRKEYRIRRATRSIRTMAKDAGCGENSFRLLLAGKTYKWVREDG